MNKLSTWRNGANLTRPELAAKLDVSTETVRRWELGLRIPTRDLMAQIQAITGGAVGPADFYGRPAGDAA